jgi:hypothetical protein
MPYANRSTGAKSCHYPRGIGDSIFSAFEVEPPTTAKVVQNLMGARMRSV